MTSYKAPKDQGMAFSIHSDEWEMPSECIRADKKIGEGCFGEVFRGEITGECLTPQLKTYMRRNNNKHYVAIKQLKCKWLQFSPICYN